MHFRLDQGLGRGQAKYLYLYVLRTCTCTVQEYIDMILVKTSSLQLLLYNTELELMREGFNFNSARDALPLLRRSLKTPTRHGVHPQDTPRRLAHLRAHALADGRGELQRHARTPFASTFPPPRPPQTFFFVEKQAEQRRHRSFPYQGTRLTNTRSRHFPLSRRLNSAVCSRTRRT